MSTYTPTPRYYASKFHESLPEAQTHPVPPTCSLPCTDFRSMCSHCWTLFETGKQAAPLSHASSPSAPCTALGHMCDYCWAAYETAGLEGNVAIHADDNCLTPLSMCDHCRRAFNALTPVIPPESLLARPGVYPVKFWKRFAEGVVDQGFGAYIATALAERLGKLFCAPVSVRAFTTTPPGKESPNLASVLVEFPHVVDVNEQLVNVMFQGLPGEGLGEGSKWTSRIPRQEQCLCHFRLRFFRAMVEYNPDKTWREFQVLEAGGL
ncbi:uncharacterized protein DSM5745_11222 [Aspergillus mulundensis]|uniref:Uncharacterized protein n=1 Tax=Aspergillus mulundensis TaxID=1810919 RepID=A0A3D8Q9S4_9EURO|nr:hypothetical protein DSM5745_11222 [Aspergillus mulundensis]RDW58531.1 hypothetical protein DSM5745_11222 [Aspergillus mulundensis]